MKKHILMVAVALSLTLAGCGSSADDQTVTVTGSANVRDAATAEGSSVLETLSAGTVLTGRWVENETNPSEKWFEFERDGEKAYVWAKNLSAQSDLQIASAEDGNETITQPETQVKSRLSEPNILSQKADEWQGCSLISATIAAVALSENNNRVVKDRMQSAIIFNNIATYLIVLTGESEQNSREILKTRKYYQSSYIEELSRNSNVSFDLSAVKSEEDTCNQKFKDIENNDYDTYHVVQNFDIAKGTEKFE